MLRLIVLVSLLATTLGFAMGPHGSRSKTILESLTCPTMAEGEREILDGSNGPVLVTKVAGSFYAVDATCPHLGLPMKKGKISTDGGKPTLTCNFHNSCFELESGKCTQWVTGALGFKSGILGSVMGKVGGEKQDIKAYKVIVQEDGSLLIE